MCNSSRRCRPLLTASLTMGSALLVALLSTPSQGAITGWDFEDGTLQGWTTVSQPTTGPLDGYVAVTHDTPTPISWRPLGVRTRGTGSMAAVAPWGDRDDAQDAPLVLRSPTFELASDGVIAAHALGGTPGANAVAPANFSDLSGPSIATSADPDASYLGIALRRDSDGAYLLTRERSKNKNDEWENLLFSASDLAPIIANNPGELFTLDLIDTAHSNWGSLALDDVSIPVASTSSLVEGGGKWTVRERIPTGSVTTLALAEALMALPEGDPGIGDEVVADADVINYSDFITSPGHFGEDEEFIAGIEAFATHVTGAIHLLEGGDVTFGFYANDGARLMVNNQIVAIDTFADLASNVFGTINLPAGVHEVDLLLFQGGLGASLELFVATTHGEFNSLADANFELLVATDLPLPEGIPGDYNNDRVVDAADYTLWRNHLGSDTLLPNDETPGVTIEDYDVWKQHFGQQIYGDSLLSAASSVPEPSSVTLITIVALVVGITARRGAKRK